MEELDDRTLAEEKLFYERFKALHEDPLLVSVLDKFGIEAFRRSSVLEGFDGFLKQTGFKGACCLEIGSFNGLTAFVLSRYFERVVSLDIVDYPLKYDIMKHLNIKNVEFHGAAHNNMRKAGMVRSVKFDAAYVDGNHDQDTEFDFDLVKHCGRVLFHEYWKEQPTVKRLVDRLAKKHGSVVTRGKFALWTA